MGIPTDSDYRLTVCRYNKFPVVDRRLLWLCTEQSIIEQHTHTHLSATDPNSLPLQLSFAPLHTDNRVTMPVDFTCKNKLGDLTLDGKNYYKLTNANNPLFDSFTIECEKKHCRDPYFPDYDIPKSWRITEGLPPHPRNYGPCTRASQGGESQCHNQSHVLPSLPQEQISAPVADA